MGTGVPLLNEYKQEFVFKRLPQTILGGLKLRLGYDAPIYAYLNQLLVFGIPFVLGGLFTLLVELDTIKDYIAVCVFGASVTTYVLLAQLISFLVQVRILYALYILTLSQTSLGFYVSAVEVFRKHCGKRRNCSLSFSLSHSVFYPFAEFSAILIKFEVVVCNFFQFV